MKMIIAILMAINGIFICGKMTQMNVFIANLLAIKATFFNLAGYQV